jgi:hypothetical protein
MEPVLVSRFAIYRSASVKTLTALALDESKQLCSKPSSEWIAAITTTGGTPGMHAYGDQTLGR